VKPNVRGALRLVCRAKDARPPTPPLGVSAYTEDPSAAVAILLELDAGQSEREQVDDAWEQIPAAESLTPGQAVVVLPDPARGRGIFGRLFAGGKDIPRAIRATALLARGYTNIGAGKDDVSGADLVWGEAEAKPKPKVTSLP
jgi:hypothetical protein